MDNDFYTLKGYKLKEDNKVTDAMEDYLEMIYRIQICNSEVHIKDLAERLNLKPSSASKMISKLSLMKLVMAKKYGTVSLTDEGESIAKYLYLRHDILVSLFKMINKKDYKLEQVEKIEHFVDFISVNNIKKYLNNISNVL